MLLSAVQPLGGCSDARVVWDLTTGRSAPLWRVPTANMPQLPCLLTPLLGC